MKKILVTGADGFIGSHLVERLVELGYNVKAFVFYNSFNSWGWIDTFTRQLKDNIEIFTGDIRDPNGVYESMKNIDVVFHLAALIGIPFSYHSPDSYIDTNIKGTLNILQAARKLGIEKTLVTSTSEVYGTAKFVPITEEHPFQGQSPYSASKIGADRIAESFYRSFDLPVTIVRPFNTFGPRQSARAVIPTIITQLAKGIKDLKLGDITPTRDLVYVKDTVEGFIEIYKSEKVIGEEINIATQSEISVLDLAILIAKLMDMECNIISEKERFRPEKSEVKRLLGSNEKLKKLTEWQQKYSLEEGLKETIKWFLNSDNLQKYKFDIYNI
ncbi:MAG: NAD-dependent 4,6-dehydratase LegB [Candidatus Woesearchaeota archaeon]